jgi:hypothetical protein
MATGTTPPKSQHSVAEERMVEPQKDDSANDGGRGAVEAADVETRHAGAVEQVENPADEDRADNAEQDVDDGALAGSADNPAREQAVPEPPAGSKRHSGLAALIKPLQVGSASVMVWFDRQAPSPRHRSDEQGVLPDRHWALW